MHIDMTPILEGRTDKIDFSFDWEGMRELFDDRTFPEPAHIVGNIINRSGYMLLTLNAAVGYETVCARCLDGLTRSFSLGLTKNVVMPEDITGDDGDDFIVVADSGIDADEVLEELMFLELPSRDLCKEDCLGLCPKCGQNLNEKQCGCEKKEIDPRLAVLKKFLDDKE